ncbi:MAG TPA: PRC-barrel domain-containing protein [Geminicoccaceae bacterium]|nr:PRC-barrel domain-containing protein [Geminicoccaceae bacterium]
MNASRARVATALALGLTVAAPAAWAQQQQQGDCLERVGAIQRELESRQGADRPNLSHLVEAARRYAAEGQTERCFEVVGDMEEYLGRVGGMPATGMTGQAVQPDVPPPVGAVEGAGRDDGGDVGRAGDATVGETLGGDQRGTREAVSPVEPPAPGTAGATTSETTETFADVSPDELRVDRIVGQPLLNNWGKDIGEIRDVVVAADDPDRAYAVVSRGGGLLGGDEGLVVVELSRLRMVSQLGIQFAVGEDSPDLDDMPAYDPAAFRSLSEQQQQPTGGAGAAGAGG